jgi:hypothetical protein
MFISMVSFDAQAMNFGRKYVFLCGYPFVPLDLQVLHLLGSILSASCGLVGLLALGLLLRSGPLGKLLDVREELWRTRDVLAQDFGNLDTLL